MNTRRSEVLQMCLLIETEKNILKCLLMIN